MRNSAIHLAFQLAKQPDKLTWLCVPESPLPAEMTDLLRLCASSKRLEQFALKYKIKPLTVRKVLVNFIEKVLIQEENSAKKILGFKTDVEEKKLKLHYQLLMKIFHPDSSISKHAANKTILITKSYKTLKSELEEPQQFKNIKLSRTPPKSFYQATQSAEAHHVGLKNTSIIFGAMAVISLAVTLNYLLKNTKAEIISKKPQATLVAEEIPVKNTNAKRFSISKANFSGISKEETTETILQMMLRDIETYYEKGIVKLIKPILANTLEMRSQSDEEMQQKLKTLFEITQERKMMLYDFKWQNISGKIRGVGKFISRYQLTGQLNWQVRKGVAVITAEETNDNFSVTGLQLQNDIIE